MNFSREAWSYNECAEYIKSRQVFLNISTIIMRNIKFFLQFEILTTLIQDRISVI